MKIGVITQLLLNDYDGIFRNSASLSKKSLLSLYSAVSLLWYDVVLQNYCNAYLE